ncbi:MAG TPA: hypothetical protein V6C69_22525 [Trichormus sp.]|jgi:hypothetical protein
MEILLYTVLGFALVGLCCTVLCVACKTDLSDLLPVYNPRKKKVRSTFWGRYADEPEPETAPETFQLPKVSQNQEDYVIGSSNIHIR